MHVSSDEIDIGIAFLPDDLTRNSADDELFERIVGKCLLHEPHQLTEIVEKIGDPEAIFSSTRRLKKDVCHVLRKAILCGYVVRKEGFFLLTHYGRLMLPNRAADGYDGLS